MSEIKVLILESKQVLISEIEEVVADLGEPNCKLIEPFLVQGSEDHFTLVPWLMEYTNQNHFIIYSEKIITIIDPKPVLLEKYKSLLK
jgi:hypothetical protein